MCTKMVTAGSMDCTQPLAPGDERTCTITSMGASRTYIEYAPKNLNLCNPAPVVFDAHGATETATEETGEMEFCAGGGICYHGLGSGWKQEADQPDAGFIAIFGQGVGNVWSAADAQYFLDVLADVQKQASVDTTKVYISGISNGGAVSYETACAHTDVFAGFAPMSGADASGCGMLPKAIPMIAFDDMPDFAYQGSVSAYQSMIMNEHCKGTGTNWATIDGNYTGAVCRSAKEDPTATIVPCNTVTSAMLQPTTCTVYDQCDNNSKIVFCEVAANDEHGAANASLDGHIIYENNSLLNIPSLAWKFFKSFSPPW
jgi:poly(3-hydroxybutyrate) depolymerase